MKEKQSQAIGIFDSGIGGLTVMREIMKRLPNENLIYYGDTARLPYGNKSSEVVTRYSMESASFLVEQNIKLLVVACNTATAYALDKLQQTFGIPVLGVIEPGAEKAIKTSKNNCIAVLGTKGTIGSGVYQRMIEKKMPQAKVVSIACPLFVPLVEESFLHHPVTSLVIKHYLAPLKEHGVDTVLLGCTHYPMLKHKIAEELMEHVAIIDSACTCAEKVAGILNESQLTNHSRSKGNYQYFVSDDPIKFQHAGSEYLGDSISNVRVFNPRP